MTSSPSEQPHAAVPPPRDYDELFHRDGPYIEKMVRKHLGPGSRAEDVEDVAQYIAMKLVDRDVLSMYDRDHPSGAAWLTFLGKQIILYCRGQRESITRHVVREPARLDAPAAAGEESVTWYEAYASRRGEESWDSYPALSDAEVVARLRAHLAAAPATWSGPVSLVELFDLLVRRVYAGGELTAPVLATELHMSPRTARRSLDALRAALAAAVPRPRFAGAGGVSGLSGEEIRDALAALEARHNTAVRQTLAAAGSRLAAMDYHAVAKEEMAAFPDLKLPPGTKTKHHGRVKLAVMHRLRGLLAELEPEEPPAAAGSSWQDDADPTALEELEAELWRLGATSDKLDHIMDLARSAFAGAS